MIGSSKSNRKIIRENYFEDKKNKPGLSANRHSNWAQYFLTTIGHDESAPIAFYDFK